MCSKIVNFCFEATRVGMLSKTGRVTAADKLGLAICVLENAPENKVAVKGVLDFLADAHRHPFGCGDDLQILGLELAREHCPGSDIGMGDMDHYQIEDWRKRADLA